MKKTVFFLLLSTSFVTAQCDFCGEYISKNEERYQKLIIKTDSTFEYEYRDNWATLMGGFTEGKWYVKNGNIVLNSEYDKSDYSVQSAKIDMCQEVPKYLNPLCDSLVKIQVKDIDNNYIWFFKNIVINNKDSLRGSIGFEDINDESNPKMSAFIKADSINQIQVYNGFYKLLDLKINKPNVNHVIIKGNFADQLWYTYIKNEEWEIRRNRLINNKRFGKFKKKK